MFICRPCVVPRLKYFHSRPRFRHFRRSSTDSSLFLLSDPRRAPPPHSELDDRLNHFGLFDDDVNSVVWKFVSDIQKDPYTTTLTAFSKLSDRLLYSTEQARPEEEVAELLQQSMIAPDNVQVRRKVVDKLKTGDISKSRVR